MSDMAEQEPATPFDPRLKAAMEEIKQVCQRYDVAFTGMLVSPTHSEYAMEFPTWSVAYFDDDAPEGQVALRIRSKQSDFADPEMKEKADSFTVHMFDQWMNWHKRQLGGLLPIWHLLGRHWDITSDLPDATPHYHDIVGEAAAHDPINQAGTRAERRRRQREEKKRGRTPIAPRIPLAQTLAHALPTNTTIAAEWDSWQRHVLAPVKVTAGDVQYIECRRAFYAGGWSAFQLVNRISDGYGEEEAMGLLSALHEEFTTFTSRIGTEGF